MKYIFPNEKHNVIVTESYEYSPSLYYADKGFIVPPITDKNYINDIIKICDQEKILFILPTKDTELIKFAGNLNLFKGIKLLLSSLETIVVCEDKLNFYEELKKDFNLPKTFIGTLSKKIKIKWPVIIKERGKGIETSGYNVCRNQEELNYTIKSYKYPIVQEYIEGQEYTVDCIFNADNSPICIVPRKRLKIRQYVSDVGLVDRDDELINLTKKLGKRLKLTGPANIQWIKNSDNIPFLIEVNPRISGGLQISLAACPDFIKALIQVAFNMSTNELEFYDDIVVMKYDSVVSKKINE
ncbi:MAG: hypothetical protein APR63_06150 [Desulfuromonas sp. SDB]|nr:MAG: hypothetical protein APR63_06150 [Desulfuromonas sp. SDB]